MQRIFWLLLFLPLANAFAFGGKRVDPGSYPLSLAEDLPRAQAERLVDDWDYFRRLEIRDEAGELAELFGPEAVTQAGLEQWLRSRLGYIVSVDYDFKKSVEVMREGILYENPGVFPAELGRGASFLGRDLGTWMVNIGTAVYLSGKLKRELKGLRIPGFGLVPLRSPRVGVVQLGAGFFLRRAAPLDAGSAIVSRLATLFHEARHSDGRGESLGFLHVPCPEYHAYAGSAACDFSLNGAYTIGAVAMKRMLEACRDCSAKDEEQLRISILDSYSRVVEKRGLDPLLEKEKRICAMSKPYIQSLPIEHIAHCEELEKMTPREEMAVHRDPLPESLR